MQRLLSRRTPSAVIAPQACSPSCQCHIARLLPHGGEATVRGSRRAGQTRRLSLTRASEADPRHGLAGACSKLASVRVLTGPGGYIERTSASVRLLEEQRFDLPRPVEVENDGQWWPEHQSAWRLCDDGFGWRAAVTWRQQHEYGWGPHLTSMRPEQLRLPDPPLAAATRSQG
jgi:hypothetical protein